MGNRTVHARNEVLGRVAAAERFRALIAGSSLYDSESARSIQDALSFRCLSQVHGAAMDALERAMVACELEFNTAADNPLVLTTDDEMLSTGNFHLILSHSPVTRLPWRCHRWRQWRSAGSSS